jgi:hypothetical protein
MDIREEATRAAGWERLRRDFTFVLPISKTCIGQAGSVIFEYREDYILKP